MRNGMLNKESLQTSAEKALTPPHDPPPNHCVSRVAPRGFIVAWFRSFPGQSRARTFKPFVCVFKSIFLKKKKDDGAGSQWTCSLSVINQILHRDLGAESFTRGPALKTRPVGPRTVPRKVCLARETPCSPKCRTVLCSERRRRVFPSELFTAGC